MDREFLHPWKPDSWRHRVAGQQPLYPDAAAAERVVAQIRRLPPLVTWGEVDKLRAQIAEAQRGERFLLQGGDCAESFDDCTGEPIANKLKILLQMSLVLVHGARKPVIRVGRFAGQYAKPRSEDLETRDGLTLPTYRGDLVNRPAFTPGARAPDPDLLLRGYERSALTLNFIRALVKGGFADLHHPEYWSLGFVEQSAMAASYRAIVEQVREALRFMENVLGVHAGEMERVDFFTSHEGLHLVYEQAQTRLLPGGAGWYNASTHFPWLGMRTAGVEGAHVEYFRGIANPIGVKIGPGMTPEQIVQLAEILDPDGEPGRLTLIHRFGHARIAACLPPLIQAMRSTGRTVLWCCDPMHGNTRLTADGIKTRHFSDILSELEQAIDLHAGCGSLLGGVHFELTGEDVTECLGGARNLTDADLKRTYRSEVDPRLNYEQALEMAMRIAGKLGQGNP
ncbi:MAG TPA: 3-deoxy-7-phosphoheptulonate synthase class II [Bryobacteraceae bacterium]|nr:3-deoxy-7-phosphoheptulonate synthase class II [Bryobacteraceae bacterium]